MTFSNFSNETLVNLAFTKLSSQTFINHAFGTRVLCVVVAARGRRGGEGGLCLFPTGGCVSSPPCKKARIFSKKQCVFSNIVYIFKHRVYIFKHSIHFLVKTNNVFIGIHCLKLTVFIVHLIRFITTRNATAAVVPEIVFIMGKTMFVTSAAVCKAFSTHATFVSFITNVYSTMFE